MITKEQTVNVEVPDGYELKTEGIFRARDLVLENRNWISGAKLALETGYALLGIPIREFKVPVARRVVEIME